jgi:hypothetical protein
MQAKKRPTIRSTERGNLYSSPVTARQDFDALKLYLRWRIEKWMAEDRDRQAKDFARAARISPGHLSGVRHGGGVSDDAMAGILEALGLGLKAGVEEALVWAATQPQPTAQATPAKSLVRIAIDAVSRDGVAVPRSVRETVLDMVAKGKSKKLEEWQMLIRNLSEVENSTGRMSRNVGDTRELVQRTARRPLAKKRKVR